MNPVTCDQVTEHIELYVAGECAEPERSAIRRHLTQCPACARIEGETCELLGLLDLRLQESDRLGRLQALLKTERTRKKPLQILAFTRRAAAVAAMLLVAIGLSLWFRGQNQLDAHNNPLIVALGPAETVRNGKAALVEHQPAMAFMKARQETQVFALDLKGKTAAQFRQEIKKADPLPQPALVNLTLEIRNASDREVKIYVGGEGSELDIRLNGPGVVTTPAPANFKVDFLDQKTITREPGQSYFLPITRLVYGSRANLQAAYWTEPGEYTLNLRYQVAVSKANGEDFRFVTLRSPAMRIQVR
jgi:hypothetical protein